MKIIFNPNERVVAEVMRGLEENGGYCPCRTEKSEDTRCICTEFRNQAADPDFSGYCRCMLYCTTD